ncbi:hypothetical protein OIN60_16030 [Paenibacillus sp. P96]|uniref:Sugar ABC transporter permease n=1 Tax=Paenibacillus zeirhizosphaerae TaxID=2987519 RepID=A0ABT9FU61_9BACL|nr:hypothetical protein [Paenibacillus sp. P96]MDP4098267.1 hypothetical protein [Paenibacillus sp. P96]
MEVRADKASGNAQAGTPNAIGRISRFGLALAGLRRDRYLYLLTLPGMLYFIIFKYVLLRETDLRVHEIALQIGYRPSYLW